MTRIIRMIALLLIALLAGGVAAQDAADNYYLLQFETPAELVEYFRLDSGAGPIVVAHRGGGTFDGFPELAVESFENALRYGPAIIEVDVRLTADNQMVLMHDETIDRTTTGSGNVGDFTLAELRELRLVNNDGEVTPYRIPTLEEALAWAKDRAVVWLDIKNATPEQILEAVNAQDAGNRVVIAAYTPEAIDFYFTNAPEYLYTTPFNAVEDVQRVIDMGADMGHMIGLGGWDTPNLDIVNALAEQNVRTLVSMDRETDPAVLAGDLGVEVYQNIVDQGVMVLNTDNYPIVAEALGLGE
ncbi:MAG: glycerophosphodiester phosphodiesterase family protein [Chloroflexi bacterium]|nr:glycerophosphodiester phosphodiesterase family protein [Chloroflexota bacterium]